MNDTLNEYLENLGHYLDWEYAAPDWANWFAVDRNGWAHWFMLKPTPRQYSGAWRSREEDGLGGEYACILPQSDMLTEHWAYSIVDLNEKRKIDANKPQPRPGAHIWKAWAEGKAVETKMGANTWVEVDPRSHPMSGPDERPLLWRVKPATRQLLCKVGVYRKPHTTGRVAYVTQTAYSKSQEKCIESDPNFYMWITDWIDVAVPND